MKKAKKRKRSNAARAANGAAHMNQGGIAYQNKEALAGILTFTDKLIDMETANKTRRMIEMTKIGWIIEQEKQEVIAKLEEEKQQALAKAEAEKRQAAKESVIKMIRKNYSTEEIAFIVSSFSQDDIEAVRREIGEVE